jgi:hypothetical protein
MKGDLMRLATTEELTQMESEEGIKWAKANIHLTIYGDGSGVYYPDSFKKSPMFQCLKCQARYLLDTCANCGNNTFKSGGDRSRIPQLYIIAKQTGENRFENVKDMGIFCEKCDHGVTEWQCNCGTKNPVTKTLFVLEKKGGCFIATAAYGSVHAPEITLLQQFRDMRLRKNRLGSFIISVYEQHSPPLADWIAGHPIARLLVQKLFLAPIISILRYWK